jgi:hypothetical protein
MNKQLKSPVYKNRMLYNRFKQINSKKNWEAYRTQRNLVTKLKKRSINNYFIERCTGGAKAKYFWPTVKPFLTNKGSTNQKDIILQEQNIIETDQHNICETFNNCFVNVAKNSGDSNTKVNENHPIIIEINKYEYESMSKLDFQPITVTEDFVSKRIGKINVKKATGIDGISPNLSIMLSL